MSDLRLALLLAGILAIAGIFLWETVRAWRRRRGSADSPAPGETGELPSTPVRVRSDPEAGDLADRIIALHVVAEGGMFRGEDILSAVRRAGLRHGPMGIFHHFNPAGQVSDIPLFSVSDLREPGTFDLERMGELTTRGLSLFMCLPTPSDDRVVFEKMLDTANLLAQLLGGTVYGPDRRRLDPAALSRLRGKFG